MTAFLSLRYIFPRLRLQPLPPASFCPIVGIWGAVIGTVVAYIVLATARMIDVNKYIEIKIDHRKYFLNCTTIIAQGIIVSADFYVIPVSIVSIVLFVLINRDMFNILLGTVKRK